MRAVASVVFSNNNANTHTRPSYPCRCHGYLKRKYFFCSYVVSSEEERKKKISEKRKMKKRNKFLFHSTTTCTHTRARPCSSLLSQNNTMCLCTVYFAAGNFSSVMNLLSVLLFIFMADNCLPFAFRYLQRRTPLSGAKHIQLHLNAFLDFYVYDTPLFAPTPLIRTKVTKANRRRICDWKK